jgi:hypothetical protein
MTWREKRDEKAALRRFELQWARTSSDRSHDFSAYDGELLVGRVYRLTAGPDDRKWSWSMTARIDGTRVGTETSVADDRDAACLAVERAYRRFGQRIEDAPSNE